jgi:hypothetical protein
MSKQLVVESKNGAENIRLSRLATRQSNLEEDRECWKTLSQYPCSKKLPIYKNKYLNNGSTKKIIDHDYDDAMNVGTTITQRIVTRYADDYCVTVEHEVTPAMIQDLAKKYLTWPVEAQLLVCRDPSRQSIDEEVQKVTLEKYLPMATVEKPTNGVLTLVNGDIVKKPKKDRVEARSIDFVITTVGSDKEFYVFAKFSLVAGSGQGHQADESHRFLQEAIKYIVKHDDSRYFISLLDGGEAERHIPELQLLINGQSRIFAGNCEQVVDWINTITK